MRSDHPHPIPPNYLTPCLYGICISWIVYEEGALEVNEHAANAVALIAVAVMVLGVSYCTIEVGKNQQTSSLAREQACWDRGGFWNTTGWNGAWCDMGAKP